MTTIIKIEKLKDDLSNATSSVNLLHEQAFRSSVNNVYEDELISEKKRDAERQRLIDRGYSRIVGDIYYTTYPTLSQRYLFKEIYDTEFIEY